MSRVPKFSQGEWSVETRKNKIYPFISNGEFKVADIVTPEALLKGECSANAQLISCAPHLYRNLDVTTLFLRQLIAGEWSEEEIKEKAEALFYTNSIVLTKSVE